MAKQTETKAAEETKAATNPTAANAVVAAQPAANAVQKIGGLAEALPAHLAGGPVEDTGLDATLQYVRPPRLKIIQKQSATDLLAKFDVGDIILAESQTLVSQVLKNAGGKPDPAQGGAPFHFVPVFFFTEYCLWNPYMPGTLPPIRARSLDPLSEIAKRAKNSELWYEPCPESKEGKPMRYCEHLVFVVSLLGEQFFKGDLFAISFLRGSFKYGVKMSGLLNARRHPTSGHKLPMWSGQFMGRSVYDPGKGQGDYWAMFVDNPTAVSAYVQDPAEVDEYGKIYAKLKKAYNEKLIVVDYDAEAQAEALANGPGNSKEF